MPLSYFLTQHGASISEYPIDPECIHEHVCIQWLTSISLHVVPENIPRKKYPNSNVKLQYQYRIKLEMSITKRTYHNVHEQLFPQRSPLIYCMDTHVKYTERAQSLRLNISQIRVEPQQKYCSVMLKFHRYWDLFTTA